MNLIPSAPGASPNCWCTWSTQNFGREDEHPDYRNYLGETGARFARAEMNEKNLNRWLRQFPRIRGDLYLLFDDGWDVPYGVHPDKSRDRFGTLEPDEERFPSFRGTPPERLQKLNEFVRQAGWRGLGLWVPAQAAGSVAPGRSWKHTGPAGSIGAAKLESPIGRSTGERTSTIRPTVSS